MSAETTYIDLIRSLATHPGARGFADDAALLPVGGDIIAGIMSTYLIWEARNLGMSKWHLTRMGANTVFDTLLGFIPFVGDAADVFFRSNTKNLRIVRKHLDKHHPETAIIDAEPL